MESSLEFEDDMNTCAQEYCRGNYESCVEGLTRILEYLPSIPEHSESIKNEKKVLCLLLSAYIALYGYGSKQVADVISRASMISRELQDNTFIFSLLWTNWSNVIVNGNIVQAQRFASEIAELADQYPKDNVIFVEAFHCLGVTEFNAGQFQQSANFLATGLQKFEDKNRAIHIHSYGNDAEILLLSWLGWANLISGNHDLYLSYQKKLVDALQQCKHNSSYAFAYVFNAMSYVFQDQPENCLNALNTFDKSKAEELPFWRSWANIIRKWAEYHTSGNLRPIKNDIQDFIDLQGGIWTPFFKVLQADINANENPSLSIEIFDGVLRDIKLKKLAFHALPALYFYCKFYRNTDPSKVEEAENLARTIITKQGALYWQSRF